MPTAHSRVAVLAVLFSLATTAAEARRSHHHHSSHHRNHPHGDVASYYSRGQKTASGQRFNPNEFTAAHRSLPFNSIVRIINRRNGRSVVVRVSDRGPGVRGRTIDVSRAAARRLGMLRSGVVPVRLEVSPVDALELPRAFRRLIILTERREVVAREPRAMPRPDRAAQQEPAGADAYAMAWEPEVELPMLPPLRLLVIQPLNIIRQYVESLLRPIGNCQGFSTVDERTRRVAQDIASQLGGMALAFSCWRSVAYNRKVGGVRHSQHIAHKALDFRVVAAGKTVAPQRIARLARQHPLMRDRGGIGTYCGDFVHVDVGPKRNWHWGCGRRHTKYAKRHSRRA